MSQSVTGRPTTAGRKNKHQSQQPQQQSQESKTVTFNPQISSSANANESNKNVNIANSTVSASNPPVNKSSETVHRNPLSDRLFEIVKEGKLSLLTPYLASNVNNSANNKNFLLNEVDEQGWSPLMYASDYGHIDVLEELLRYPSVNVHCSDNYGLSALHLAASHSFYEIMKLLIQHKANINQTTKNSGYSVLMKACQSNNSQHNLLCVQLLVENKVDLNYKSAEGLNCLHVATINNNINIVNYLLSLQILDINTPLTDGRTVLFLAAENGSYTMISELISNGANPALKNKQGQTVLDIGPTHSILIQDPNTHRSTLINKDSVKEFKPMIERAITNGHKLKEQRELEIERNKEKMKQAKLEKEQREKEEKERLDLEATQRKAQLAEQNKIVEESAADEKGEPITPLVEGYLHPAVASKVVFDTGGTYKPESKIQLEQDDNAAHWRRSSFSNSMKLNQNNSNRKNSNATNNNNNNEEEDNGEGGAAIEEETEEDIKARAAYRKQMEEQWKKDAEEANKH